MQLKDYYKTLGIAPTASSLQVKKSFRQLALKYHPDKNPGDAYAEAQFKEIQEAYEILSDPKKREDYNYKRWYTRSLGKEYRNEPLTPVTILAECGRLNNYISGANVFHVDFDTLSYHIRQLLSETNIGLLQQFNDKSINSQVVKKLLQAGEPLPLNYMEPVAALLMRVAGSNNELQQTIRVFMQQHQQKNRWQRYKIIAVVFITILICWVIYRISK
jgi:molecular chaperone DnaJ